MSSLAWGAPRHVTEVKGVGAEYWIPVGQWLGNAISQSVVDFIVATSFAKLLQRLHDWRSEPQKEGRPAPMEISRGAAALVGAAYVSEQFGESGTPVVEAVEEPSSFAGHPLSELSYAGIEPLVVMLRSDGDRTMASASRQNNPQEMQVERPHETRLDSIANLESWRTRLSPEELNRIRRLTERATGLFYTEDDW